MRVLLLTYYYPPDKAVGGQRARKVADALRSAGHSVTVIAAGDAASDDESHHRVRPFISIRQLHARLKRRYASRTSPAGPAIETPTNEKPHRPRDVARWKRWIFSLIWLPDDKQGFILPAVRKPLGLPGGRPDLVYTTAPPFSVHLAGLILRALTGARWVAEFRDPWTTNPLKPDELRSAFSDWLERKLEWLCLETADLLIPVSDGIAGRLAETGTGTPLTIVRNGIDQVRTREQVEADVSTDGPFEIVHAGSFYHARDPFPFLTAVKQVVAANGLGPEDLRVRFIGATPVFAGRSIGDYVREERLDDYVRLEGWIPPERSLRHIQTADLLLLLAIDQPDQVPNKLYEYLGARRPILAVADAGGETARMLDLAGGHCMVPVNEAEHIRLVLERLVREGSRGPVAHSGALQDWSTASQMAQLCAALASLGSESASSR